VIAAHLGVATALVLIALLVLWLPYAAGRQPSGPMLTWLLTGVIVLSVFTTSGSVAFGAMAVAAVLHARQVRLVSRTAVLSFWISAGAATVASVELARGSITVAFVASLLAIAVRAGVMPLHAGIAELSVRRPALQTQNLATLLALVVTHLRFADQLPLAFDIAPLIVRVGAVLTLTPALIALVQRDLRGFYRSATMMHGGMLLAGLGAAGRGHPTAALMVIVTIALAMAGLALMMEALEERVGAVALSGPGGRVQAFPRLAAAFLLFGGAGVAMPGTAGFIADDLLLHALWEESVPGTLTVILGSALLAVATLATYSKVFLGRAVPSLAPDLGSRERWAVVALVLVLVWLGVLPATLLEPADPFLRVAGDIAPH
jgi:NADH:ubiquinone oxidoreductase subunit 4 (subunit M)